MTQYKLLPPSQENEKKELLDGNSLLPTLQRRQCKLRYILCLLLAVSATFYYGFMFLRITQNKNSPSDKASSLLSLVRLNVSAGQAVTKFYEKLMDFNVDIWATRRDSIDFLVKEETLLLKAFRRKFPKITILLDDVEKALEVERSSRLDSSIVREKPVANSSKWFEDYHTWSEIIAWYKDLAKREPLKVRILPSIGKTFEGRDIIAISITNQTMASQLINAPDTRPKFYIQAGIHAREWISSATCQYIAKQLGSSESLEIAELLNLGEFLIIPIINPDGYVYSWESDRLWRKNRVPFKTSISEIAFGVDLNRNFDSNWGNGGSSNSPFSDIYMGPSAASEEEVKAVVRFFNSYPDIVMALDLHSYSQLILRPVGWQREPSEHEAQLSEVSKEIHNIIKKIHKKKYISEKSIDLYPTTGSADDWFYMQSKQIKTENGTIQVRPYSLTIELRPSAEYWGPGFILDKSEILPTGEEILPAIIHLAKKSVSSPLKIKSKVY